MTLTEKVAYLKGLMEGLNTDDKVIGLIADILSDMAGEIQGMQGEVKFLTGGIVHELFRKGEHDSVQLRNRR